MKPPKNTERIRYLAYHHKKARVRKKNLKRLQKYYTQTFDLKGFVQALNDMASKIIDVFRSVATAIGQALRSYPQDPPRLVDNVDSCVCCDETIPEGRQVCPSCERSDKE